MLAAGATALLVLGSWRPQCPPDDDEWASLAAYVVSDLSDGEGDWFAKDARKWPAEKLRVEVKLVAALAPKVLEILIASHSGCSGESLRVRLSCSAEGRLSAEARSVWSTHIGGVANVLHRDLNGHVLLDPGSTKDAEVPRLAFRLHAIEPWCGLNPVVVSGSVELSGLAHSGLPWATLAPAPVPEHAIEELGLQSLAEVTSACVDGTIRARGHIDTDGRRHGLWTTFYPNGATESEAWFRHGERDGPWASFLPDGPPLEAGTLRNGLEEGSWTKWSGDRIASGSYADGKKSGTWLTHENGRLILREEYENGVPSGTLTTWWPNGNKRSESRWKNGWPAGPRTTWNEDGSLEKTTDGWTP